MYPLQEVFPCADRRGETGITGTRKRIAESGGGSMSKFCPCIDNQGYCSHIGCPYFLEPCPVPIDELCPMGCNNPEIDDELEE